MNHLRLLPRPDEDVELTTPPARPDISDRMLEARGLGSIEAALHAWGARVRASRGADIVWCTTRPPWPNTGRLYNWRSPVWLPTAEEERNKPLEPFRLSSLFDRAA